MPIPTGNGAADSLLAGGMVLLTGLDVGVDSGILDIISKLGVIAVLWFWIRDMKSQITTQMDSNDKKISELVTSYDKKISELTAAFDKETNEIREHYRISRAEERQVYDGYLTRVDASRTKIEEENKQLKDQIFLILKDK